MKITLLGHASVLVEMAGVRCLMDPVFRDPFEEGIVTSCPKREIRVEALPKIDVLILSHAHLDHFDIPSLARIPRDCDVLCPKEKMITYALKALGFKRVHDTDPMTRIVHPDYEFMTTRSSVSNVIEFGVVFKDKSGVFWNQVDTLLSPHTIAETLKVCDRIDLLFAMHASQNFKFFESKSVAFPAKMHEMNLNSALAIRPRMIVPGAAGFRFCGGAEWCNAFLFPMSRERFIADLARLDPTLESRVANPGDVFNVSPKGITHEPGASKLAVMLEDDTALLRFDPTRAVPELTDPNPDGYPQLRMELAAETCVNDLAGFVRNAYAAGDEVVASYRALEVTYAIGVVFPDSTEAWFRLRFEKDTVHVEPRATAPTPSDMVHRVAASALTAWVSRERTYFYLRAFSRKFTTLYGLRKDEEGKTSVETKELEDLLGYYLDRKAPGAEMAMKRWLDLQLKPFVRAA